MAPRIRLVLKLAAASALLAAFIPGIFESEALGQPRDGFDGGAAVVIKAPPQITASAAVLAPVAPQRRVTKVPVGCERFVSPLVKSASAFQVDRCVT